jgi:hypothetical protein
VLVWEYGLLDGRAIDWSENVLFGWLEVVIWVVTLLAIILTYRKTGQKVVLFAVTVSVLQSLSFLYGWVVYKRSEWKDEFLEPINEFSVDTNPVDSKSWHHTNTYLDHGEIQHPLLKSTIWNSMPKN